MLPVNWLYVNNYDGSKSGNTKLVKALANAPHESLFSTDLVITLVDSFWYEYYETLFYVAFLPFLAYFATTVKYFAHYTNDDPKEFELKWLNEAMFRAIFYVLWTYFTIHEFI